MIPPLSLGRGIERYEDRLPDHKKPKLPKPLSKLEETFALHVLSSNITPMPEREHKFHPERKWRFDFAWPEKKVAVECEGGVYSGGRHTRGEGYTADLEKYNTAALMGWLVLRFTSEQINSLQAIKLTKQALEGR